MPTATYLNRIGTAVPPHDVHQRFIEWARCRMPDREAAIFDRMVRRAAIDHRWSILPPEALAVAPGETGFYPTDVLPSTAERMALYARAAPELANTAIEALGDVDGITHLVVASCTGFVAPGIDQILARRLGLADHVERTLIGFMGCYAAVAALRTAHHIVRSRADARVLVVTVELSSLHLQPETELEALLAMLLFGDGATAALVSADPAGLEIDTPFALALPESEELITWTIGDTGFAMHLSGEVPARLGQALGEPAVQARLTGEGEVDDWAVHAGGRTILDSVEAALALPSEALAQSRRILSDYGNMSSSTLMFVLAAILAEGRHVTNGRAIAFGPGLAAEGFAYRSAA